MSASRRFRTGTAVSVLYDERGREPILDERPFRAGFAGNGLFIVFAVLCTAFGALAVYVILFA